MVGLADLIYSLSLRYFPWDESDAGSPNCLESAMTTRLKAATADGLTPEQALAELLALGVENRRAAVAKDVRSRSPRYRNIPAHDLAEALGIPEPWKPGEGWTFTRYARLMTVEEYAMYNSPASEVTYMIEDSLDPERLEELIRLSEPLDDVEKPCFSFLTRSERNDIEDAIAERQLEANESNGMCCLGHCSVKTPSGAELQFEGDIEDDGQCITLRTPYDKRTKRFVDLSRCRTSYW